MSDAYIKFERENLDGLVAVESHLSDVCKRFGVRFENECNRVNNVHFCELTITEGVDLLSEPTNFEVEHFATGQRRSNRRLACETRIISSGEISIMTDEKREPKKEPYRKSKVQEEFDALPLDKKIENLFRMEAVTLGETFTYVINSPLKVVEKVGDMIADFGMKIENEARRAARPKPDTAGGAKKAEKAKAAPKEQPPPPPVVG
jgi:ferredoxin